MIWLTWRQHRAQLLVTGGLLLALGVMFLISGREAAGYVADHPGLAPGDLAAGLGSRYNTIYTVFGWLPIVAPALIGAFWGAPLLGREFERGTNKLAWTQSVPLGRWLGVKLGLLAAAVVTGGLVLSAMVSLWRPVFGRDEIFGNVGVFNMVGVAPAAWWLFGFTLGTAAGALLRRTLPAMAVVVAVLAVATFGLFNLSAYYAEPVRVVAADRSVMHDDVRLLGQAWTDPAGREIAEPPPGACPRGVDTGRSEQAQLAYEQCLLAKGYRFVIYVHGPSQFWRFQWTEAAILVTASLALGALTVSHTLRRRV